MSASPKSPRSKDIKRETERVKGFKEGEREGKKGWMEENVGKSQEVMQGGKGVEEGEQPTQKGEGIPPSLGEYFISLAFFLSACTLLL